MAKGKNKQGSAPKKAPKQPASGTRPSASAAAAANAGGKRNRLISKRGRTVNPCREPRHVPRDRGVPVLQMEADFHKHMIFVPGRSGGRS
jgi:hypothetical protein